MKNIIFIVLALALTGCTTQEEKQAKGFAFPRGDATHGKEVFIKYQCLGCHLMKGMENVEVEPLLTQRIGLGGRTTRLRTQGELVTAVVNPSHKIARLYPTTLVGKAGDSNMKSFNDQMTISELIDLVEFVGSSYRFTNFAATADDYDPRRNPPKQDN